VTATGRSLWFRRGACALAAGLALVLSSCESGGHFTLFGYTTRPNYDPNIHTVYVPMFKNLTFYRGLEFQLTAAVVREIEAKTPFKVVSNCDTADTELLGTIISYNKNVLVVNQNNEVREAETTLGVEVVWRDRRTGDILSQPRRPPPPPPLSPDTPPPPTPPLQPPVLVQSIGHFIPELGGSLASAQAENVNKLAIQIVSMMEKPW
jgi:hypothetical protein